MSACAFHATMATFSVGLVSDWVELADNENHNRSVLGLNFNINT